MLARSEQSGGDREPFGALQRLDRGAGRDPPVQRDLDRVVGGEGGGRAGSCGGRRDLHLGYLDDFERPGAVGQAADELALLERGDEAMDPGLRLEVERLTHLVEA